MRRSRLIMGMPVTVEIVGAKTEQELEPTFQYFYAVDERFSTYKPTSEISRINRGEIAPKQYSREMKEVFRLAEATKRLTNGSFDVGPVGRCDPSGLVKGWAINNAARHLRRRGYRHFFVDAGGDIAVAGFNESGEPWRVGIRNPFNLAEIVKVVALTDAGIATSGNYERGAHIYNPLDGYRPVDQIASVTVIGPNIYEADRFATAAFVMGLQGINFIDSQAGLEGYQITKDGLATETRGFSQYVLDQVGANR